MGALLIERIQQHEINKRDIPIAIALLTSCIPHNRRHSWKDVGMCVVVSILDSYTLLGCFWGFHPYLCGYTLVGRDDSVICELSATILSFLPSAPGGGGGEGTSPNKRGTQGGDSGEKGEEGAGGAGEGGGTKPQLRVYIPGQKEFVPRTVSEPTDA